MSLQKPVSSASAHGRGRGMGTVAAPASVRYRRSPGVPPPVHFHSNLRWSAVLAGVAAAAFLLPASARAQAPRTTTSSRSSSPARASHDLISSLRARLSASRRMLSNARAPAASKRWSADCHNSHPTRRARRITRQRRAGQRADARPGPDLDARAARRTPPRARQWQRCRRRQCDSARAASRAWRSSAAAPLPCTARTPLPAS